MQQIKPGDVVRLRSGSRPMTVESIEGEQVWVVAERDNQIIRQQVSIIALAPSEPASGYTIHGLR